ncbi:CXXX repeat peptide modification system protein [Duncaniella muris]|uniref:CXXX repeat peptide modification system protein n=1 Tax=Duncaniella muris TaxID=2094150 RepID=UPI003F663A74
MKKEVGHVTEQERDEIQSLFERRNGLVELAQILTADKTELYERLIKDMGETSTKFQQWWNRMGDKYQWDSTDNGSWEIDFNDCTIYLVTQE